MARPCSERFRNRDNGILWNKQHLELGERKSPWNKLRLKQLRRKSSGLASMSSADEYYAYVGQCIALASKCLHPADKARLLQMAKAWRDLAEKVEASQNKPAAKDSA
jgi:hypothetical protein